MPSQNPPFYLGALYITNTMISTTQDVSLLVTTGYVNNQPVRILFDPGSQVNTISPHLIPTLNLTPDSLQPPWELRLPARGTALATHGFHKLTFTLIGYTKQNKRIPLQYDSAMLILDSPYDLLLGIPFMRNRMITQHYCNNTLHTVSTSGEHLTIPLHTSNFRKSCIPHCPFRHLTCTASAYSTSKTVTPNHDNTTALYHISSKSPPTQFLSDPTDPLSSIQLCTPTQFIQWANDESTLLYCCLLKTNTPTTSTTSTNDDFANLLKQQALKRFPSLFPDNLPPELPPADRVTHSIDLLPNAKIPPRKLYRQSISELNETKKQLTAYIEAGHIRPSTSAFGAPILLVRKKDGSMRMCVDYRGLNDITLKNTFPIPRIDDLHDQLGNAHYFTKLDLYSGYHQIQITPGHEHKTAFTSRYGTYEFTVMPFGLTNAPSTFQTAMHALFHDWLDDFIIVYLDDILIYSSTQQVHTQHLYQVLQRLTDNKWYCKIKKCHFAQTSIEYLGHIISHGTISIDPEKMKAVTDWPTPFKNLTEVQSFLGLVGYYRKFIPHFSHIARPLHQFSHKDKPFLWEDKHTDAVTQLKNAITSPDCLAIFDPTRQTILTTDACEYAIGASLNQRYDHGERPIAFISKILTTTEKNYAMWEKEFFAVIWSVKYFRPYLTAHHFTIRSDNKPTTQLLSNTNIKLTITTSNRVARWINTLQVYNYTLQHHPGKSNVVADALSRFPLISTLPDNPNTTPQKTHITQPHHIIAQVLQPSLSNPPSPNPPTSQQSTPNTSPISLPSPSLTTSTPLPYSTLIDAFVSAYQNNHNLQTIYDSLLKGDCHARYRLHHSLIITREDIPRVFIPDDINLRTIIFTELHNTPFSGHPGFHKFYAYIQRHFTGPRIRDDILDFVRTCPECQKSKPRNQRPYGILLPLTPPQDPWQDISMDLITGLTKSNNCNAIFVIVDRFSKMAHFIPTTMRADAPALAQLFLDHIVRLHGMPQSILSDRDPRFLSLFWKELFTLTDTTLRFSTPNHPQTDGQTERTNRTLEQYLRIHVKHRPARWAHYISLAEIAYNNSIHSATGVSPFYLVYQRHINLPLDLALGNLHSRNAATESLLNEHRTLLQLARDNLAKTRANMIHYNQHKDKPPPFNIGDHVLVHHDAFRRRPITSDLKKFDDRWFGPYPITKVININAYELQLPPSFKTHNVVNISFLQTYKYSTRFPREHPDHLLLPPVGPDETSDLQNDNDEDDEKEVDSIIKCRLSAKRPNRQKGEHLLPLKEQLKISRNPHDFEFLIKWTGLPLHEATWEPYSHLTHTAEHFDDFIDSHDLPENWRLPNTKELQDTGNDE